MRKMTASLPALIRRLSMWRRRRALLLESKGLIGLFAARGSSKDVHRGGYVLIIVMLVVTLLISVSAEFLLNAQININYMKKFKDETQAASLAEAGLNLSSFILDADTKGLGASMLQGVNSDKNTDAYTDLWAIELPDLTFESGSIQIYIDDEQSKINLNAIRNSYDVETKYYAILERFFINMGFTEDYPQAIYDWVDINESTLGGGAESADYYNTLENPYNAKNAPFDSIDELLLVRYFTPEIYYGYGGGNYEEELKDNNLVETNTVRQSASMDMLASAALEGEPADVAPDEKEDEIDKPKYAPERSRALSNYLRTSGNNLNFIAAANMININTASYRVLLSLTDTMTPETVEELIDKRNAEPFSSKKDEFLTSIFDDETREKLITFSSEVFMVKSTGLAGSHRVVITCILNRSTGDYYYYAIQ